MKQRRLLILAVTASFATFAQEIPSNTQEHPNAQTSFITDELTGSKVYEGSLGTGEASTQAAQPPIDAGDGEVSQKEDTKENSDKPNGGNSSATSGSNSSSVQKKTQGTKNTTTSGGTKKSTSAASGTTKKTTSTAKKSGSAASGTTKKSTNTKSKSTTKKNTTTSGGTNKKNSATSSGKTSTKSSTASGKKQTSPKTQSTAKPSEKPKQQTQSASVSSETSLPQQKTQQDQVAESSSGTSDVPDENLKTQEENQNQKTQALQPAQNGEQSQNASNSFPVQNKNPSAPKSSGDTAAGVSPLPSPAMTNEPPAGISEPQNLDGSGEVSDTAVHKAAPERAMHFVSMKNSQYLDVTYPEGGWIFLGEEGDKPLLRYFGRKIAGDVTSFSLRSRGEGKTVLHFYKSTANGVIDDYIEVEIKGKNETQDRVKITPYSEQSSLPSPKDEPLSAAAPHTGEQVSLSTARTDSSATLLAEAKHLTLQADYGAALKVLDELLDAESDNADEALFLQAQIFESSWEQKNIRGALDCYETIVRRYPQSSLWEKANERAIYLKKFYFDIR